MTIPATETALSRVHGFLRRHQEASASRVQPWRWGTAFSHEGLPRVYDLNFLRLDQEPTGITVDALVREAERIQHRLGHREIWVQDEALGASLVDDFKGRGWKVNQHIVMAHRRPADRASDISEVREVDEATVWPSRAEFLRTYEWCRDDETVAQMHGAYRVWMSACEGRDFAVSRDGKPVSFAMLWRDGSTAQIEDVATLEPYRNKGLSRSVITKALQEAVTAGCDLTFLIADVDDWPKELYKKLGFDPIGSLYYFVKVNS